MRSQLGLVEQIGSGKSKAPSAAQIVTLVTHVCAVRA
jgi:hypothetical protein